MKHVLLILQFFVSALLIAQLPSGSQAPDFSTYDIHGNPISLSEILEIGKSVVIDFSTTWCNPCWAVHEAHILDDMYYAYGAGGSNEVEILFVEGDPNTSMADLYGEGNNTLGNWVAGAPYTIIDDADIAASYSVISWPIFFTICPDGILTHIVLPDGQYINTSDLSSHFANTCNITLNGVPNHVKVNVPNTFYICSDNINVEASFKNLGNNIITSASFELQENGNTIASTQFSGSVSSFVDEIIVFEDITLNSDSTYKIILTSINNQTPFSSDPTILETPLTILDAEQTSSQHIEVTVMTDSYPNEMSMSIEDSAGNSIFEAADFENASSRYTFDVVLPSTNDCYSVKYLDVYGDGWRIASNSGVIVMSEGEIIYDEQPGDFGAEFIRENAFGYEVLANQNVAIQNDFIIYPNPSNGVIQISLIKTSDIKIIDVSGKTVAEFSGIDKHITLDLSFLQKGVYFLELKDNHINRFKKLIIK